MAHVRMHAFICDGCSAVAGADLNEEEALRKARDKGWEWRHPGWQLFCPNCSRYQRASRGA